MLVTEQLTQTSTASELCRKHQSLTRFITYPHLTQGNRELHILSEGSVYKHCTATQELYWGITKAIPILALQHKIIQQRTRFKSCLSILSLVLCWQITEDIPHTDMSCETCDLRVSMSLKTSHWAQGKLLRTSYSTALVQDASSEIILLKTVHPITTSSLTYNSF